MGFKDKLKENLRELLSEQELSILPSGFQTIGKIMIIKLNPKLLDKKNKIGKICLEAFPYMKSIYSNSSAFAGFIAEIRFITVSMSSSSLFSP